MAPVRTEPGIWPIDPDPARTNLTARQHWHLADDGSGAVTVAGLDVAGVALDAEDPRFAFLDVRRDAGGRPWPAAFAHSPATGEALTTDPPPAPALPLRPSDGPPRELPLPGAAPHLLAAGRPAALYLFDAALGALDWWDAHADAWRSLGRLPPATHDPCAGPHGLAYAAAGGLVSVALPQLGPDLAHSLTPIPGRAVGPPAAFGDGLAVPVRHVGGLGIARLHLRHGSPAGPVTVADPGGPAPGTESFAAPVANHLGDVAWAGKAGALACTARGGAGFTPWPEGFSPVLAQAPLRDRGGIFHQLGTHDGRYHYASLGSEPGTASTLRALDGPHATAGAATYRGGERYDTPWADAAESPTLGPYAGALLLPLLTLPGDTVLLALRVEGVGAFLRGERLARPVIGHLLHHAHGAGIRRLPVSLEVGGLGDAIALVLGDGLYCASRLERRCHRLGLVTA